MKIVVLDAYTLNPGDLTWKDLEALGECTIYDRSAPEDTIKRADKAAIVLTNKTMLSADIIDRLDDLRYIGVLATGYNVVDAEAAGLRGIPVTNVPTYGTDSVAQMAFAHLLNLTQNVAHHAQTARDGRWSSCQDFCYWDTPLIELAGLTMGIIGFGRIGRAAARLATAFGMKVIAHDPAAPPQVPEGCEMVSLDKVLQRADVISLHCPLTPETKKLINAQRLAMMKKTALLINTSRGPLIDEHALAKALNSEQIAGAGLDVLSAEPPEKDNPLLAARNCHITPHIAWATLAARQRLLNVAVDNVRAYLTGKPQSVVNNISG